MACSWAAFNALRACEPSRYAWVGAPPEKEVAPEFGRNGTMVAALARILRGAFAARARLPTAPAVGLGAR